MKIQGNMIPRKKIAITPEIYPNDIELYNLPDR